MYMNQILAILWSGLAWPGLAWPGLVWSGLACLFPCNTLVWPGLVWPGLVWPGLAWSGLVWSVPLQYLTSYTGVDYVGCIVEIVKHTNTFLTYTLTAGLTKYEVHV